ncbi:hypothetical protein L7F22_015567 [Adiantum nelumboides]|nr:hypothetical protein [Adiantum nelumboides]
MKVKHEAVAGITINAQAAESKRTLAMGLDNSSVKTIEFLRARLLAERAASKSARQQAQEMSEKVKDLHIRLETEIEHRKESEAAMGKMISVLKAKGVVMDSVKSVGDTLPSDHVKEAKEVSGKVPCVITNLCSEVVRHPIGKREENSTQTLECTTELHGNLSVVVGTEDTSSTRDACGTNPAEGKVRVPLMDSAEHQSCLMNQVQGADCNTNVVFPDGTPFSKAAMGRGQSIQQGICITTKLKTMLQQIEEEVVALPEEQPLRTKVQGLAGHLANMLERGPEAGLESKQPEMISCSLEGATALETKNGTHVQRKYAREMNVNESRRQPGTEMQDIVEGIDRRERLVKRLFPSPKALLQQRDQVSSAGSLSASAMEDTSLQSNVFDGREPSSVNGDNRDAYVGHCLLDSGLSSPHCFHYDNPHLQKTCPPMIHWGHFSGNNNFMGEEPPYLVEVPSPQSSDALSVGDNLGYLHGQHNGIWSPGRASPAQNAWSPARVERQSRAMFPPNGYFVDGISNELLMQLERGHYNHQNMYLQGGSPPRSMLHSHQERDLRNSAIRPMARQLMKDRLLLDNADVSAMDDKNGRLGSILMALDAARQLMIQGEKLVGPTIPPAVDAWLKRGYPYGDRVQQWPPGYQYDNSMLHHGHAPMVQFPSSPTSEQGCSPFERPHGVHRSSGSVSTNLMISEWDNSLQPSGEVHLGNGITLYTD